MGDGPAGVAAVSAAEQAPPVARPPSAGPDLRKQAVRGTAWTTFGYGASYALRFAGTLVLTRLLEKELFGLNTFLMTVTVGIKLFTDVGIGVSIVQHPRGEERTFLDTAWTIQVIRGLAIWLIALVLAWPIATLWEEPRLVTLLPVVALTAVFDGLGSTSLSVLNRRLALGRLALFDLWTQWVGLIGTCVLAAVWPTIWALVLGFVATSALRCVASHLMLPGPRDRLRFDKDVAREIASVGRWILFATAMTFLSNQSDRLLLGKLFGVGALLGVYGVACQAADIPRTVLARFKGQVMFPVISRFVERPREELRAKLLAKRRLLLFALMAGTAGLTLTGDWVVELLFEPKWHDAAWMLPLLAIGIWPRILGLTIDPVLYALGKPKFVAFGNLAKVVYMIVVLPLATWRFGVLGAMVAIALNDLPYYVAVAVGVRRERVSGLRQDLAHTLLLVVVLAALIGARVALGLGVPGVAAWQASTL